VSKYTAAERQTVKSIVAYMSIKRISEKEIMKEVFLQTNKTLSRSGLQFVKKSIKKESSDWYNTLMKSDHDYIHQFKERIDEIIWLQRKHHELIDKFDKQDNSHVVLSSLQELHKLNVTLSNYFDVAPDMKNNRKLHQYSLEYHERMQELANVKAELNQLHIREAEAKKEREREKERENWRKSSAISENDIDKDEEQEEEKQELICYCDGSIMNHYQCSKCNLPNCSDLQEPSSD